MKFQASSMAVQPGLCQTWLETQKTDFLTRLKQLTHAIITITPRYFFSTTVAHQGVVPAHLLDHVLALHGQFTQKVM